MNWLSLLIPFSYLGILVSSLATFSSLYRKRKAAKHLSLAPYFPPHTPRNLYLSLLHLSDTDPSAAKVPDSILRAALLARATEDINRILEIRTRKQALQSLLQRGVVGDEIWQRLLRAERDLEEEVRDVVSEANAFSPNWGQTIFQSASEMANNAILKKKLAAITTSVPGEKEWWDQRRQSVKEALMKELDEESSTAAVNNATASSTATAAAATSNENSTKVGGAGGPKLINSDDDTVIVEQPAPSGGGGTVKGKKKKPGKK